jgi:hypothetical protein
MSTVRREDLFNRNGFPFRGLESALLVYRVKTLEELEALVASGEITESDIYRTRGNGSHRFPGRLPQYLFKAKSREEQVRETIMNNLGAGI